MPTSNKTKAQKKIEVNALTADQYDIYDAHPGPHEAAMLAVFPPTPYRTNNPDRLIDPMKPKSAKITTKGGALKAQRLGRPLVNNPFYTALHPGEDKTLCCDAPTSFSLADPDQALLCCSVCYKTVQLTGQGPTVHPTLKPKAPKVRTRRTSITTEGK